jgi:hypothetical protein
MAAPFGVTTSGFGLELGGMVWDPFNYASTTFLIDGLGLVTQGFLFNLKNNWFPPYATFTTVWTGFTSGCCP